MRMLVAGRSRAVKAFIGFILALAFAGLPASDNMWWLDAWYLGIVLLLLFAFSIRTLLSKWGFDDARDATRHGPMAAYPERWRRWLMDDYSDKERHANER